MYFTEPFPPLISIKHKLDAFSEFELHKVAHGKWSVLQHLYHCWMVEQGVLAYIKLKTQNPDALAGVLLLTRIKFAFFFTALRLGVLKVNAPDVVQKFPKQMSADDLINKWQRTRKEADTFFLNFSKINASKGIFRHVFIGRMNKKMTQKFIELHLRHHLRLCNL